ncbi:MAG TPA: sensor histidine kinase [Bryobacteraceae bacterium]|jgi:signal transduction histidine kinase
MIPYRGRLSLRIARIVLALACLGWYGLTAGLHINWLTALLTAYAVYSFGALSEVRLDSKTRSPIGVLADTLYFGLWAWFAPGAWMASMAAGYLLASSCLLQDVARTAAVAVVALLLALLLPSPTVPSLVWAVAAAGAVATGMASYKRYLDGRMSSLLRNNLIIRSQAEGAREAERQRIAADFHDGPLQSFISFQMRLEIIKKLMARNQLDVAADELRQLQELCKGQVADLRGFVRSMRPEDEGMSLNASLNRMVEGFQRDAGIFATFASAEFHDPAAVEVSLEILQIVRETLNNIQKHSGATRVAVSAARVDQEIEVTVEDNGAGFPFSGRFTLDELELLRLGPVSIKRRVRALSGKLVIESKPGQGAKIEIRLPV